MPAEKGSRALAPRIEKEEDVFRNVDAVVVANHFRTNEPGKFAHFLSVYPTPWARADAREGKLLKGVCSWCHTA